MRCDVEGQHQGFLGVFFRLLFHREFSAYSRTQTSTGLAEVIFFVENLYLVFIATSPHDSLMVAGLPEAWEDQVPFRVSVRQKKSCKMYILDD